MYYYCFICYLLIFHVDFIFQNLKLGPKHIFKIRKRQAAEVQRIPDVQKIAEVQKPDDADMEQNAILEDPDDDDAIEDPYMVLEDPEKTEQKPVGAFAFQLSEDPYMVA